MGQEHDDYNEPGCRFGRSPLRRVAVGAVLLVVVYVGSYLVLSSPCRSAVGRGGGLTSWVEPSYRGSGAAVEWAFWPLEQLDRRIRPDFWATQHSSYDTGVAVPDPLPE